MAPQGDKGAQGTQCPEQNLGQTKKWHIRQVLVQKGGRPGVWRLAAGMSCGGAGGAGRERVDSPVLKEAPVVGFAAPNVGLLLTNLARATAAGSFAGGTIMVWGYGGEAALRLAGKLLLLSGECCQSQVDAVEHVVDPRWTKLVLAVGASGRPSFVLQASGPVLQGPVEFPSVLGHTLSLF
jgi:hypothetical protein